VWEWFEIEEKSKLDTFTTVVYRPAGFENETPYTLAVVQFPIGMKVFGQIDKNIPPKEISMSEDLK